MERPQAALCIQIQTNHKTDSDVSYPSPRPSEAPELSPPLPSFSQLLLTLPMAFPPYSGQITHHALWQRDSGLITAPSFLPPFTFSVD